MSLPRLTIHLLLALGAAVTVAILFGHTLPAPEKYALLHLSTCAPPCWSGITPGVTTIDEAKQRLAAIFGHVNVSESTGMLYLDLYRSELDGSCIDVNLYSTEASWTLVSKIYFLFIQAPGC